MTDTQAINDRFPAPFAGLDFKSARSLIWEAQRLTGNDCDITEELLWEIRNQPECPSCGAALSHRYPLNGHDLGCDRIDAETSARRHLRVVR